MLVHLGSFQDFSLQELHNLLDVALTHEIGDQVEYFLVDLKRYDCIILNNSQDVIDVFLKNLEVVLAQLQNLVEHDHLHVVVIVLLQQIQIALNGHLDGARSRRELSNCIGAFE